LVATISPDHNKYAYTDLSVRWQGQDGAAESQAHCDCSGFVTLLFRHVYGYTAGQVTAWMGHPHALARDYHDQIVAGHGFQRIARVADVRRGDLIAVKYLDGAKKDTGHVMVVVGPPQLLASSSTTRPALSEWAVTVIDSSKSGHGPTDTRRRPDGTSGTGVGEGPLALFANAAGDVDGYAWSPLPTSAFHAMDQHHVVVGRLLPGFRP
jgi:cell wall-associated NlpC family hydrolase